ncbi:MULTISPECIES: hypothetical protein [unclassified Streptomyces]|uniref:hypothetical protein n=1 Tax=unclassified Streptomyces TaxID=2593676 RepID=UPI000AB4449C|nr:hypothetical protein [Streptomyces sp. TSRI0281]
MNRDELLAALRTSDTGLVATVHEDDDGMHILFRHPEDDRCAGGGKLFVPCAVLGS